MLIDLTTFIPCIYPDLAYRCLVVRTRLPAHPSSSARGSRWGTQVVWYPGRVTKGSIIPDGPREIIQPAQEFGEGSNVVVDFLLRPPDPTGPWRVEHTLSCNIISLVPALTVNYGTESYWLIVSRSPTTVSIDHPKLQLSIFLQDFDPEASNLPTLPKLPNASVQSVWERILREP